MATIVLAAFALLGVLSLLTGCSTQEIPDYDDEATPEPTPTPRPPPTPTPTHTPSTAQRVIEIPSVITGMVDGIPMTLTPREKWFSYQGHGDVIDSTGRYSVVVGPRVLDPNYCDEGRIWAEDFNFPYYIDAILQHQTTGDLMIINCITRTGAKAHTFNWYAENTYFEAPNGIYQTGIAYPNSWNFANETPFARDNIDSSSIEFIGRGLDFDPNEYIMIEMIVYE